MYIERQQLVEELRLRKLIQQAIRIVESKKAITEDAVGDTRNAPYDSTGLNTLNTLFDNIFNYSKRRTYFSSFNFTTRNRR